MTYDDDARNQTTMTMAGKTTNDSWMGYVMGGLHECLKAVLALFFFFYTLHTYPFLLVYSPGLTRSLHCHVSPLSFLAYMEALWLC